jgi:hypothetical protein
LTSAREIPQLEEITSTTAYPQLFKECGSATANPQLQFLAAVSNFLKKSYCSAIA